MTKLEIADLPTDVQARVQAYGVTTKGIRLAHTGGGVRLGAPQSALLTREQREESQNALLVDGATLNAGAGNRARPEQPDPVRTCFERDLDRIRHSLPFRSLAGKQQVFLFADGGLRTRLTHSNEVAQIAEGVAQAVGANPVLAAAAGYAHDCGHGPGGHDAEVAFSPFLPSGFDHALYGANVVLQPLNLCTETLDAVRCHSWKLDTPRTPEGELVSWADRIAYTVSDFQDALAAGIVVPEQLPDVVRERAGTRPSEQIRAFINALVHGTLQSGTVGMLADLAEALDAFRRFNYTHIYMRPASQQQATKSVRLLTHLVEHFADRPAWLVRGTALEVPLAGSAAAGELAVAHVAALTDRQVLELGAAVLGWERSELPHGV